MVVDLPLQSFDCATKLGVKTDGVTDIFLSHTHRDHYMKEALLSYLSVAKDKINLWCHEGLLDGLDRTEENLEKLIVHPVKPLDEFETAGFSVAELPANHADGRALHFVFEKGGKRLFYGLDGAWFTPLEWRHLFTCSPFDAMIFDATNLHDDPARLGNIGEHNSSALLAVLVNTVKDTGIAKEGATLMASHIGSRRAENAEWVKKLENMGLLPANDGFAIEI